MLCCVDEVPHRAQQRALEDCPPLYLEHLMATVCTSLGVEYDHMDKFLLTQRLFLDSLLRADYISKRNHKKFEKFPKKVKTIFRRYKKWNSRDLFKVYLCCERGHVLAKDSILKKGGKLALGATVDCRARLRNGAACGRPYVRVVSGAPGEFVYRPLSRYPVLELTRQLARLFRHNGFASKLGQWRDLPVPDNFFADVYFSPQWKLFDDKFLSLGEFNIAIALHVDW